MVIEVLPSELDEFIESMPAMVENCRSSGVATEDAMVSGLAPGSVGADLNGGIIHARQGGHRQRPIGHDAEQQDAERRQSGEDRTADEELGNVHQEAPSSRLAVTDGTTRTGAPGIRRSCPSVTTVSPGAIPLSITILLSIDWPSLTVRFPRSDPV